MKLLLTLAVVLLPSWPASALAQTAGTLRPIVIQGAMTSETEWLVEHLDGATREEVGSWNFWRGTIDGYPVVVSKTNKGTANAAAATVLAVERFRPLAIVNQGTSGGHDPALRVFDIVIGTAAINIGAFRTPFRKAGAGSAPGDWIPLDLNVEASAGAPDRPRTLARFEADSNLLAVARGVRSAYTQGRVVEGIIGSSDMWIDEIDRVTQLHNAYGTSVEEMETASAAQVAAMFQVPFVGIRVVSDNVTNGATYDPKTGEACERFVYAMVKAFIASRSPGNAR